jgi:hypothetical protein
MVSKYKPRRESLSAARKLLLQQERIRVEELRESRADAGHGRLDGRQDVLPRPQHQSRRPRRGFYQPFRRRTRTLLPELYPHFVVTEVQPGRAASAARNRPHRSLPKFLMTGELGILELDSRPLRAHLWRRRAAPRAGHIEAEGGASAGPPCSPTSVGRPTAILPTWSRPVSPGCSGPTNSASSPRGPRRSRPCATPACATSSRRTAASAAPTSSPSGEDDIGYPGTGSHLQVLRETPGYGGQPIGRRDRGRRRQPLPRTGPAPARRAYAAQPSAGR